MKNEPIGLTDKQFLKKIKKWRRSRARAKRFWIPVIISIIALILSIIALLR